MRHRLVVATAQHLRLSRILALSESPELLRISRDIARYFGVIGIFSTAYAARISAARSGSVPGRRQHFPHILLLSRYHFIRLLSSSPLIGYA